MKSKGFWILFSIMLGAVGVSLFDVKWSEHKEEKKKEETRVFQFSSQDITKIKIAGASKAPFELEKNEKGWFFNSPVEEAAESTVVTELLNQITTLLYLKKIDLSQSPNWNYYGLEGDSLPFIEIETGDKKNHKLFLGLQKNIENQPYLKKEGESFVYLGVLDWSLLFEKDSFDFRDKKLVKEGLETLSSFEIKKGNTPFVFYKQEGVWSVKGQNFLLDQNKVRDILYTLTSSLILEYKYERAPNVRELQNLGFNKGQGIFSLVLNRSDNKLQESFEFSQPKGNDFYIWIKNSDKIVKISQSDFKKWESLSPSSLRDRSYPFKFESQKILSLSVKKEKDMILLNRSDSVFPFKKQDSSDNSFNITDEEGLALLDKILVLTVDEFIEDLPNWIKKDFNKLSYAIEFGGENNTPLLSLSFGPSFSVKLGSLDKKLIPVKSNLSETLVFISEVDFNKLGLSAFFEKKEGEKKN